jgi:hypothetical protein
MRKRFRFLLVFGLPWSQLSQLMGVGGWRQTPSHRGRWECNKFGFGIENEPAEIQILKPMQVGGLKE